VIEEVPSAIFSETGGKTLSETGEEFLINWGSGNAGNITLKTNQLILQEGGQISTTTYSKGQGGDILIEANNISISGIGQLSGRSSGLFSESDVHSEGSAGEIALTANRLDLEKNARVSTRTFGIGEGGIIKIHVTGAVNLAKNATIASGTRGEMENAGDGGFIILEADTLTLNEDSTISAKSTGAGLAGNINLTINTMLKTQDSAITTETNQADGGNIKILSDGYVYLVNGKITTSVKAQTGNGGNVTLSPEFVVLKGGKIIAQAVSGAGGNIDINTTSIYRFPPSVESIIDASSKLGIDGEVSINSPEIDIEGALYALPDTFTDVSTFLRQCGMIDESLRSSFLVIPYAGQLNSPADWKPSGLLIQVSQANGSTKRNGTSIHSKYQTLLW
jgi:large exoprotein involved in heme utilization and adhesion